MAAAKPTVVIVNADSNLGAQQARSFCLRPTFRCSVEQHFLSRLSLALPRTLTNAVAA